MQPDTHEGFWGKINPFARKKYVQRQTAPIRDRVKDVAFKVFAGVAKFRYVAMCWNISSGAAPENRAFQTHHSCPR